jgi:hypothetical protein
MMREKPGSIVIALRIVSAPIDWTSVSSDGAWWSFARLRFAKLEIGL